VRDTHDPLFGRRGRSEAGADRREALIPAWETYFPAPPTSSRTRKRPSKPSGPG
jgi:hypothetical protein